MKAERPEVPSVVFIVDDDASLRASLGSLIRSVGLGVELFASAQEFLNVKLPAVPRCLVLDVRMPRLSGLDFQTELAKADIQIPIIFMTGHGDIPMTVQAMKAGAVEFLTKPFRDQEMLDAIHLALERDQSRHEGEKSITDLRTKFDSLTQREKEVMALVTAGLMNKQVAGKIGVTEVTVKVHRGSLTRKMGAKSLAELVRMADALKTSRK